MKFKLYIFLIISALSYFCSSYKATNESYKLVSIINSKAFKTYFRICEKEFDTIKIYNNQSKYLDCPPFKIDCDKTIQLEKSNIAIDVNSSTLIKEDKIVLYKIEKIKNRYLLSFISLNSNRALTLAISERNKIEIIRKGTF